MGRFEKCLIVCAYNPSKRFDRTGLYTEVAELALKYEHVLLCADFNIDLLNSDNSSNDLVDRLAPVGLKVINKFPIRFSHKYEAGLLDLLCVSDSSNVLAGILDQDMIFASYNLNFNNDADLRFY